MTSVIARTPASFEVLFKTSLGAIAVAEELDVYVEGMSPSSQSHAPEKPTLKRLGAGQGTVDMQPTQELADDRIRKCGE